MKKLSVLLLAALMLIALAIPVSANFAAGTTETGHTWVFDESTGTLTVNGTGALGDYPKDWHENKAPWKSWADQIKTVVLGEGITGTGKSTFCHLKNLTSVQLPSTLQLIDNYAFAYSAMTTMVLPDSLTTVGDYAFYRCQQLKELRFPATLEKMGAHVFDYCTAYAFIYFYGDLPEMPDMCYPGSHLNIFYPKGNETWAEDKLPAWDGDIVVNYFTDCINDHTYGGWLNIKEPTEDEDGVKQRICGICKHIDYASVPKLGGKTETTPSTQPTTPATEPSTAPTQPTAAPTVQPTVPSTPASTAPSLTAPPMPTIATPQPEKEDTLPSNLGSVIGLVLAVVMVIAVAVVVIVNKRKK